MRKGELDCIHGVGHSANSTHGCDGCCFAFARAERERIIKLLEGNHKRGIADSTCGVCNFLDSSIALIKGEESNMQKMQIAKEGENK